MKNIISIKKNIYIGIAVIIITSIAVMAYMTAGYNVDTNKVVSIGFSGEYLNEEGRWSNWNDQVKPNTSEQGRLELRGHFNRNLENGDQLHFYIQNLEVHISVNGQEIYSYAEDGSYPDIMQSAGSIWGNVYVDEIDPQDVVEITLITKYQTNYFYAYDTFLDSMCLGDAGVLLMKLLKSDAPYAVGGIFLLIVGLFILLLSGVLWKLKIEKAMQNIVLGIHFIVAGVFIFISGRYITLLFPYPYVLMFVEPICITLIIALFMLFLTYYVNKVAKIILDLEILLCGLSIIYLTIMQFSGTMDTYASRDHMAFAFIAIQILAVLISIYSFRNEKKWDIRLMMVAVGIYGAFIVGEGVNYFTDALRTSALLIMGLVILLVIQGGIFISDTVAMVKNAQKVAEYEKEIADSKIAVMFSQIQPHFLYNALNTIRYLCKNDPGLAAETVEKFSKFLRVNLASVNEKDNIMFENEIDHLENYLAIERLRFNNIRLEYDLQVTEFLIPMLTVQPIVENAIKHGIAGRKEGGTIIIQSGEDEDNFIVKIIDNGIGFVPEYVDYDSKGHIGISNTRKRIEFMCQGTLNIQSEKGSGTEVTITLPKGVIGQTKGTNR